jgi:hypothetical protein
MNYAVEMVSGGVTHRKDLFMRLNIKGNTYTDAQTQKHRQKAIS